MLYNEPFLPFPRGYDLNGPKIRWKLQIGMEEFLKNRDLSFGDLKKERKIKQDDFIGHDLNCGIAIETRKNDLHRGRN